MKARLTAVGVAVVLSVLGGLAAAQETASNGVPSHLLVTVEPRKGHEVPAVNKSDVLVYEGHDRDTVVDWVPAQGDHAALELFILIDDASSSTLGTQLGDLRKFIDGQPPTAKVGVAYMQNGIAKILQAPSSDHELAAKALRLPMGIGGAEASPYFSVTDLVKRWPASDARHEVFMVTDGIDRYYGSPDLQDPYLQEAIDAAGRAGVVVSGIYNPGAGHFGHSRWLTYWGQIYFSELAEKTGGEMYYFGFEGSPVAFAPYLDDSAQRLDHQYFLTFLAKPPKRAGWVQVRLRSEQPVDLVSAGRVWVSSER